MMLFYPIIIAQVARFPGHEVGIGLSQSITASIHSYYVQ